MAHILVDRVKETTTTTGTGTLALLGAVSQFRAFSAVMANNDTTNYAIVGQTGTEWEVGRGTWTTGNNLARTTILASSNAGAVVNLSAGTKNVFMTLNLAGEWPVVNMAANASILWPGGSPAIAESGGVELLLSTSVTGDNIRLDTGGADRVEINGILTGNADSALVLRATTTGAAAVSLPAGTLKTTPADGDLEADATNWYGTTDAGNRGYIPLRHYIRTDATRTYTSNTASQPIFNVPTNGRLTLETGTYRFEGLFSWGAMSGTSGNRSIELLGAGTATLVAPVWTVVGLDAATATTGTGSVVHIITNSSPASCCTGTVGTSLIAYVTGGFEVSVAGTLIPSTTMVTAAASTLSIGSSLEIWRVGDTSRTFIGQWD